MKCTNVSQASLKSCSRQNSGMRKHYRPTNLRCLAIIFYDNRDQLVYRAMYVFTSHGSFNTEVCSQSFRLGRSYSAPGQFQGSMSLTGEIQQDPRIARHGVLILTSIKRLVDTHCVCCNFDISFIC